MPDQSLNLFCFFHGCDSIVDKRAGEWFLLAARVIKAPLLTEVYFEGGPVRRYQFGAFIRLCFHLAGERLDFALYPFFLVLNLRFLDTDIAVNRRQL